MEFAEGHQFGITIPSSSQVRLAARRNLGEPITCERFFAGVNDCERTISYINGATVSANPGYFKFIAGTNVVIMEDPTNHRIFIGLNFTSTKDICPSAVPNPL